VRDEQDGEAEPLLELDDLGQDVALHHRVERGGRLGRMTTSGSVASAIAIITRCRMPPDSSCG
jgi:hypothetical protein